MKYILLIISVLSLKNFAYAGHLDTLEIFSVSMQKNIRCIVVTPNDYSVKGDPYPVVYLLHGYSGNYTGWLTDAPQLRQHADTYKTVLVFPDGGFDSWYVDSPVDSTVRYETHIVREVLPFIEYYYHVKKDRSGRAIAGLSMGGHGALLLAARNPGLFGAAGSMCGGLDLRPWKKNDWDLKGVLGDASQHWENWEQFSVVNQVERFQKSDIKLIIDCGLGDFFLPMNRAMHQTLVEAQVPHEYTERPGEHNGAYWGNAVDFQILFFYKYFTEAKAQSGKN